LATKWRLNRPDLTVGSEDIASPTSILAILAVIFYIYLGSKVGGLALPTKKGGGAVSPCPGSYVYGATYTVSILSRTRHLRRVDVCPRDVAKGGGARRPCPLSEIY